MVAISFLVTDRLRYVMIVSIPDTINHQELERNLFLKKTYCEVLNLKLKAIISRERLLIFYLSRLLNNGNFGDISEIPLELIERYVDKLHLSRKVRKFWEWYLRKSQ